MEVDVTLVTAYCSTTVCIIDTVYKVLYVNGLRLSSHSIKRRCDDDDGEDYMSHFDAVGDFATLSNILATRLH